MKKYKILHIITGEYCILASYGNLGEKLIDKEISQEYWLGVEETISLYSWYRLWKYNKISANFISGREERPNSMNKIEFELIDQEK